MFTHFSNCACHAFTGAMPTLSVVRGCRRGAHAEVCMHELVGAELRELNTMFGGSDEVSQCFSTHCTHPRAHLRGAPMRRSSSGRRPPQREAGVLSGAQVVQAQGWGSNRARDEAARGYTYIYIYIYTHIHIYMYTGIHIYIYIYIYTSTHIYICTYTHIHVYMWLYVLV